MIFIGRKIALPNYLKLILCLKLFCWLRRAENTNSLIACMHLPTNHTIPFNSVFVCDLSAKFHIDWPLTYIPSSKITHVNSQQSNPLLKEYVLWLLISFCGLYNVNRINYFEFIWHGCENLKVLVDQIPVQSQENTVLYTSILKLFCYFSTWSEWSKN